MPPTFPKVTIRPPADIEIPLLTAWLHRQKYFEHQDLRRSIVFVAEYDGQVVGFIAGRLMWQLEPLALLEDFKKHAPRLARIRATLGLIRAMEGWLGDRSRNTTGLYSYFCVIKGGVMRKLAEAYGLIRVYKQCATFGRDL